MKAILSYPRILGLLYVTLGLGLMGYAKAAPEIVDEFNIFWMFTISSVVLGALVAALEKGIDHATYISRIVVGSLFIVSGLIKVNDTLGFSYKLEEYFEENALGAFWAIFHDWSLPISIFVSVVEVVLGLAVLFGGKSKLTSWSLLGMTLFFAWLTYYTASCNDTQAEVLAAGGTFDKHCVTDCGCFGDALRGSVGRSLTPWESFYKDVTLMFYVLILVIQQGKVKLNEMKDDLIVLPVSLICIALFGGGLFGWMFPTYFTLIAVVLYLIVKKFHLSKFDRDWQVAIVMFVFTFAFAYCTYNYLPVKDYRPFAVGKNIPEQTKGTEDVLDWYYEFKHAGTGELKEYLGWPSEIDSVWQFTNNYRTEVKEKGIPAKIQDFNIANDEGEDLTEDILTNEDYHFIVIAYDLKKTDRGIQSKLNELSAAADKDGYRFIGLTAAVPEDVKDFRHEVQAMYNYYSADGTVLKTIVRANPGLLLMKEGVVLAKWHHNTIPDYAEIKAKYFHP